MDNLLKATVSLRGKRVLLTGDTGFKGSWLALWLVEMGAEVYGFSLPPESADDHYNILKLPKLIQHQDLQGHLLEVFMDMEKQLVPFMEQHHGLSDHQTQTQHLMHLADMDTLQAPFLEAFQDLHILQVRFQVRVV